MLTPAQIAHFEIFGFLLLRRIFTPAEIANITCEANQIWRDDLERQPDENPYQIVVPFVEERPRLAQLPEDDRIYLPIVDLLGPGFVWGGSEGHKGSFTERYLLQWHSDRPDTIGVHYARISIYGPSTREWMDLLRTIPVSVLLAYPVRICPAIPSKSSQAMWSCSTIIYSTRCTASKTDVALSP